MVFVLAAAEVLGWLKWFVKMAKHKQERMAMEKPVTAPPLPAAPGLRIQTRDALVRWIYEKRAPETDAVPFAIFVCPCKREVRFDYEHELPYDSVSCECGRPLIVYTGVV